MTKFKKTPSSTVSAEEVATDLAARERPSKSARKRELAAVATLARELMALPEAEFGQLPLAPASREALVAAADMRRRAGQRQFRYACARLAEDDTAAIRDALAAASRPRREAVAALHDAERWRDALLDGDNNLIAELAARYNDLDRRLLTGLVRQARAERAATRTPAAARRLLRYLRQLRERDNSAAG